MPYHKTTSEKDGFSARVDRLEHRAYTSVDSNVRLPEPEEDMLVKAVKKIKKLKS
jgi:hypothetical protein